MFKQSLRLGVDVGSTTAKVVLLDPERNLVFSAYRRHNAETTATLQTLLAQAQAALGDACISVRVTGSAGMGIAERLELSFVQEVIAASEVVRQLYPDVSTLVDIGGEDAKMIFFPADGAPDIRMNGACAGGTGAFIDQMATLLGVSLPELDTIAARSTTVHPIASRCGVFAKTDVQNLLSREVAHEDIAASIYRAVALQTLASLGRGRTASSPVLFCGGPLTFLPGLRAAFVDVLGLSHGDVREVPRAELLPAMGAALGAPDDASTDLTLDSLERRLADTPAIRAVVGRMAPLFKTEDDYIEWEGARSQTRVERIDIRALEGQPCFVGIDSGSTTTKIVVVDDSGRIAFESYGANDGNPIQAVRKGLACVRSRCSQMAEPPSVARSVVTGYGEDLIRAAFGCDDGMVETLAHFRAARAFEPDVSFVLDIGGQDMKAVFVEDGQVRLIELNEACSSGCGTFIETFARSLGHDVTAFATLACQAQEPCDLGTRCTVFMNSKVKQSLREGAEVGDISAGLAYSVVRNALHKVLKITDTAVLGHNVVVQGGAFRNPAIHRALEQVLGRSVLCPDIAELMGAYGAALSARDAWRTNGRAVGDHIALPDLASNGGYRKNALQCRGCENQCAITRLKFANGNRFFTGNRCERVFSGGGRRNMRGANMVARKLGLLFDRPTEPEGAPRLTLGLPRVMNFYEDFAFWCTLLVESGFQVRLSDPSNQGLYQTGVGSVMSENICFPAKIVHGHIQHLIAAGVDRIFFPMVFYDEQEFHDAVNSYNCPIVSGYPDVIGSADDPMGRHGVPLDQPAITFNDRGLLRRTCRNYLEGLGVPRSVFDRAFRRAVSAQRSYRDDVKTLGEETIARAREGARPIVVLAGRPYQMDPLVNHKIPELLSGMGVDVITEDGVPMSHGQRLDVRHVMSQWAYSNRCYHAASWAGKSSDVEYVFLNSFGCGPDAVIVDEIGSILREHGKNVTVLRIDEIEAIGSTKLRLRSLLEPLVARSTAKAGTRRRERPTTRIYEKPDRRKTIIVPEFSSFYSPAIVRPLRDMGYDVDVLPRSDGESVRLGLKHTNNEICYPGIIVVGDVMRALRSGRYDPDDVAVGAWETGGQCRASNISCLLKKALVDAGHANTPVVTLSTRQQPLNPQPGLKINTVRYVRDAMLGMVYADGLSALHHASVVREREPGAAWALTNEYLKAFDDGTLSLSRASLLDSLSQAVSDFNAIPTHDGPYPPVGIVGEIFVKYNPFVNQDVAAWLNRQGCEVILPPMTTFFAGSLVGMRTAVSERLQRDSLRAMLTPMLAGRLIRGMREDTDAILKDFRYYRGHSSIEDVSRSASRVVSLTHQYGEGWMVAGEVGELVNAGIRNVLCLQPFGCIANHVVAKGISRRLQETYPQLNLLYLDLDAGASEVSMHNRLFFFTKQAHERQAQDQRQVNRLRMRTSNAEQDRTVELTSVHPAER